MRSALSISFLDSVGFDDPSSDAKTRHEDEADAAVVTTTLRAYLLPWLTFSPPEAS